MGSYYMKSWVPISKHGGPYKYGESEICPGWVKTKSENDFLVEHFILIQFKKAFGSDLEYLEAREKLCRDKLLGSAFYMNFMSIVLPIFQENFM